MTDRIFLQKAKDLAGSSNEPVKCASLLVDKQGDIVASAHNSQREDGFTASHAEMKSIAIANGKLGRKLTGITAYGNCEPCTMCLMALIFAGVERIVFARRLNGFNNDDEKINIDSFEFVKKIPKQPVIEFIEL